MDFRTNIVLDIETLGEGFDAVIVSVAAIKFSLSKGILDEFSINIDPKDAKSYGMTTTKAAIDWWKRQDKAAIAAWSSDPQPLKEAMVKFCDWYGSKSHPTWARGGPTFDFPILETSIRAVGINDVPWQFRDCMDLRTVLNLFDLQKVRLTGGVSHSALDDCREAVEMIQNLLVELRS